MTEKLGATGQFPEGKIDDNDEGQLTFQIGPHASGGVGLNFGKPIAWVVMPKEMAVHMALTLLKHAGVDLHDPTAVNKLLNPSGERH